MYLEIVPEASKMVYLITNKFDKKPMNEVSEEMFIDYLKFAEKQNGLNGEIPILDVEIVGDIFREEYTKDMFPETIDSILNKFETWLKQYNLFDLYAEKWKCKY